MYVRFVSLENSIKSFSFVTDSKYTKIQIAILIDNSKVLYSQLFLSLSHKESVLTPHECHNVTSPAA